MLDPEREGGGQAAAGIGLAQEHVDQPVGVLLPREPGLEHSVGTVRPGHPDRRAGVDDDDAAGVGLDDPGHQLVLAPGEVHGLAVVPLALPFLVSAHHQDDRVGAARQVDGPLHTPGAGPGLVDDLDGGPEPLAQRGQR